MSKDSTPEENNHQYCKDNYFTVPEGYFNKLSDDVNCKIATGNMSVLKKQSPVRSITFISSLAAAIVVMAIVFSFLLKKEIPKNNDSFSFADSEQAITEYLEENLDENTLWEASSDNISFFDADKLKEIIALDDSIVPNKENKTIEMDTTLKKEDILEYLLNENIDPETL